MKKLFLISLLILSFSLIFPQKQSFAQSESKEFIVDSNPQEILRINTNLVQLAFIAPWTKNNHYQVFDNGLEVRDFQIITPTDDSNINWVFYLDLDSKGQPDFWNNPLKRELKRASKSLSKPTVIINLSLMTMEKARSRADIPKDWIVIGAANAQEALNLAAGLLSKSPASKKAFFWLTTEEPSMSKEFLNNRLPKELTDKSVFSYIATIKPGKPKKSEKSVMPGRKQSVIGSSNLELNTQFASSKSEGLINFNFELFLDQCSQLNLVYFASDKETGISKVFGGVSLSDLQEVQQKVR